MRKTTSKRAGIARFPMALRPLMRIGFVCLSCAPPPAVSLKESLEASSIESSRESRQSTVSAKDKERDWRAAAAARVNAQRAFA